MTGSPQSSDSEITDTTMMHTQGNDKVSERGLVVRSIWTLSGCQTLVDHTHSKYDKLYL